MDGPFFGIKVILHELLQEFCHVVWLTHGLKTKEKLEKT